MAMAPMICDQFSPFRRGIGRRTFHRPSNLRMVGTAVALLLSRTGDAGAFPLLDTPEGQVPFGTELAQTDAQDLRHQLQLVNGVSPPMGGGWTVIPRIDLQEVLTDNVLQAHDPRRFDLGTLISPGIAVAGDTPRVHLTFDFAPTLSVYARTGNLNSLTEQLSGIGNVTIVPELAFVDIRAVSGVNSLNGGLGGQGTVGSSSIAATPQGGIPAIAGSGQGLNRNNEVQTSSFGIAPYMEHRFADWGTGRLGASVDVSESNVLSGFAASPFPTGGASAQTLVTTEQTARFVTGDFMPFVQNAFDVDLVQSETTIGSSAFIGSGNAQSATSQHSSSQRTFVSDQITYQLTRGIALFVSGGHEDIQYSTPSAALIGAPSVHDLTWSFGSTLTPDPDSTLTISYGHLNGFNSLSANGRYALTARTTLTLDYGSTLGTQLEYVQNQLNLATVGTNGALFSGKNGGPLFGATNALGVRQGVFRTTTLAVGAQTELNRDIVAVNLLTTRQTSTGNANGTNVSSKTVTAIWLHEMRPDMITMASFAYAIQDQTAGSTFSTIGDSTSIVASVAWQWHISETLRTTVRYSFLERQAANSNFSLSQNLLLLGISKSF
jgi:hypothetical protein